MEETRRIGIREELHWKILCWLGLHKFDKFKIRDYIGIMKNVEFPHVFQYRYCERCGKLQRMSGVLDSKKWKDTTVNFIKAKKTNKDLYTSKRRYNSLYER